MSLASICQLCLSPAADVLGQCTAVSQNGDNVVSLTVSFAGIGSIIVSALSSLWHNSSK